MGLAHWKIEIKTENENPKYKPSKINIEMHVVKHQHLDTLL